MVLACGYAQGLHAAPARKVPSAMTPQVSMGARNVPVGTGQLAVLEAGREARRHRIPVPHMMVDARPEPMPSAYYLRIPFLVLVKHSCYA
jgi:hypothetical protein